MAALVTSQESTEYSQQVLFCSNDCKNFPLGQRMLALGYSKNFVSWAKIMQLRQDLSDVAAKFVA